MYYHKLIFIFSDFQKYIPLLTEVLHKKQRKEHVDLVLNPAAFKVMIEEADPCLIGFFDMMVNAIIPSARSAYNKEEAKKKIVAICYIIAAQRNMFANVFQIN